MSLLVDAANVVGSRPTGWWRDRPGAARELVERIRIASGAGHLDGPVVVVLEGQACRGVAEGGTERGAGAVRVVHAPGSGDDALVALAASNDGPVTLVSSDRELGRRVRAHGATVVGPGWLLDRLGGKPGSTVTGRAEAGEARLARSDRGHEDGAHGMGGLFPDES